MNTQTFNLPQQAQGIHNYPYWWDAMDKSTLGLPSIDSAATNDANQQLPEHVDCLVIGAGFTGLRAALTLAQRGHNVCVVDKHHAGFGCSARNGGLVGPSFHDLGLQGLTRRYGQQQAMALMQESLLSLDYLVNMIAEEGIECGLTMNGRFKGAVSPKHVAPLQHHVDAMNKALDLRARFVSASDQQQDIGSTLYHGGVIYERDGHLHPGLLVQGLLQRIRQFNGEVRAGYSVIASKDHGDHKLVTLQDHSTKKHSIKANEVLICTNGYTDAAFPWQRRRVIPIRSALISTEELPSKVIRELSPRGRGFGESSRLFHYSRPSADGKRFIIGGRAHDSDDTPNNYAPLLHQHLLRMFPQLQGSSISHAWSGTIAYTFDHSPHLGQHSGLWYAMGYCGSGVGRANYFGNKLALKVLGDDQGRTALDDLSFNTRPLYNGKPWFIPMVTHWYALLDRLQR